jgi:hypothetical protein
MPILSLVFLNWATMRRDDGAYSHLRNPPPRPCPQHAVPVDISSVDHSHSHTITAYVPASNVAVTLYTCTLDVLYS